ncbi:serine/threonine protein kinase [Solibacillus sp. R5-41]|uniref:Stk1 family PASTA domain-containing Ser/Thr kinase n=1 Tax=Solibacillus sp. R5-41 TaxID=2048654 RepID=UPI000C1267BE|nr:Stk1 family PASTA domain-containing Ser/Thr kinase [Solibacillus sp. R5-41]ATP39303.1 serine/threonine protein kinase [Solibacillus sp. R5-41]
MLVGKHISSRYKILQLIGGGGMSNVYLAHDIILNRDVAIKILRYDFSNEEELHRRFQREALSATSLTHPNIVSIYDVGEDGDMHYIVMEYIKGKTLKQYIQEFSPLSPARSVHIMKQLTSAMSQAHENGIIHRDIKPQNILMDEEGNVKITDFGIATSLGATSYTQTNSVLGTVHYLSPEQARGGIASMKSDIYALGIVLYELLTGELPFSGESAVSIALKHLQSETPSVRDFDASIPQSIENIVLKATAKDMRHRYASTEEMEADLDTCLTMKRKDEQKFMTPLDNEATKLIPIIKDPKPVQPAIPKHSEPTVKSEPTKADSVSKQQKKKKKWPIYAGIFAALVVIGIVLAFMLTPNKIEVPDVRNMPISEAIQTLESKGFVIGEQEQRNSEEIEVDSVMEMDPGANSMQVKGTEINLVVSIGEETLVMENYLDLQGEQVQSMLLGQDNFKSVTIVEAYSDKLVGTITDQSPPADEEIIAKDTDVVLTVSKGPEPVSLISLHGYNEANRKAYERSSGFKIHVTGKEHSSTVPEGEVMRQTPSAGTKLKVGDTVNVVISKGPEAKEERVYRHEITIPYEPVFEDGIEQLVEHTVVIYIQDKTRTLADPAETLTITGPTPYSIELTIVEGEKGAYQIMRDNIVIENKTITYESIPQ